MALMMGKLQDALIEAGADKQIAGEAAPRPSPALLLGEAGWLLLPAPLLLLPGCLKMLLETRPWLRRALGSKVRLGLAVGLSIEASAMSDDEPVVGPKKSRLC